MADSNYPGETLGQVVEDACKEFLADQNPDGDIDEIWYDMAKSICDSWEDKREARDFCRVNGIQWPLKF